MQDKRLILYHTEGKINRLKDRSHVFSSILGLTECFAGMNIMVCDINKRLRAIPPFLFLSSETSKFAACSLFIILESSAWGKNVSEVVWAVGKYQHNTSFLFTEHA